MPATMPCPRCGEDAPLVYRDYVAHCSACGATRVPLAAPAVAMAGKPSQVGGTVAKIVGWIVLACGGLFSALAGSSRPRTSPASCAWASRRWTRG
jgi:NADH pyrophosphatase NudC (nudix superfamily)